MSVAWIKVNREKHTHSVYCDGQVTNGDYIVMNNYCKFNHIKVNSYDILIGTSGETLICEYTRNHIEDVMNDQVSKDVNGCTIQDILDTLSDPTQVSLALEKLANIFYTLYEGRVDVRTHENGFPYIIFSINGYLFYGQAYAYDTNDEDQLKHDFLFQLEYITEDFAVTGSGADVIRYILSYDLNADPQKILNITSSYCTGVNNILTKLENINF